MERHTVKKLAASIARILLASAAGAAFSYCVAHAVLQLPQ